ncbi:MAG: hypothetical protein GY833_21510 [Aestuariibacter sp.]|nr:hypothetical protein [Aestuariibacter sp.]
MSVILSREQYVQRQRLKRTVHKAKVPCAILFFLAALSTNTEAATSCKEVHQLDSGQIHTLLDSFHLGLDRGYGYSLAAIAWKESLAGKVNVNYTDPSYGVFHVNLTYAARRDNVISGFKKNMLAQRLMDDMPFAARHAMQVLDDGKRIVGTGKWRDIWAYYNGGQNWESVPHYSADIARRIGILQKCLLPKALLNLRASQKTLHYNEYLSNQSD